LYFYLASNSSAAGPMSFSKSSWKQESLDQRRSSQDLGDALNKASTRASLYELKLKGLETDLAESLSNFRAVDSLLQETLTGLQRHARRADHALNLTVPYINNALDQSRDELTHLAETLPAIRTEVSDIRTVYDTGRQKAQKLVADLEWLDTDFYERWRAIIFTSSSPVSWRWKAIMRLLFAVSFIVFAYMSWIALRGAYRAHRQRLVWGERLMS